jgi:drug/metabolite transporter (DMT)-like permease
MMLNEPMGLLRAAISVFMVMGVVLITRPPFVFGHEDSDSEKPPEERRPVSYYVLGYVFAVMVPFLSAIVSILTRQCRHIYPQVLMFWFAAGTFFVGAFGRACFDCAWRALYFS